MNIHVVYMYSVLYVCRERARARACGGACRTHGIARCVCVCVCARARACVFKYIRACLQVYIYTNIHIHTNLHVCVQVRMYIRTCISPSLSTHTSKALLVDAFFESCFLFFFFFLFTAQERRNWWTHSLQCHLMGDIHSIRPLGARCQCVRLLLVTCTTSQPRLSGTTQPPTTNPRQPPLPGKAAEHPSCPPLPRTPLRRVQVLQGPVTQTAIARLPNTKHGQEPM
jgi:hypothetical protein